MSNTSQLLRFAGWSAHVTALADITGFVSLFVFFAVGGPWGFINDISSVFLSLSLIPPALAWRHLHRSLFPRLSLVNLAIGIIAMLTAAILQAALVVGKVEFEQIAPPSTRGQRGHRPLVRSERRSGEPRLTPRRDSPTRTSVGVSRRWHGFDSHNLGLLDRGRNASPHCGRWTGCFRRNPQLGDLVRKTTTLGESDAALGPT
jgi:hypothetical protein